MNTWSVALQAATRDAIRAYEYVPINGIVRFKNSGFRLGYIRDSDILDGRLLMIEEKTKRETLYTEVDELTADGWVID